MRLPIGDRTTAARLPTIPRRLFIRLSRRDSASRNRRLLRDAALHISPSIACA